MIAESAVDKVFNGFKSNNSFEQIETRYKIHGSFGIFSQ